MIGIIMTGHGSFASGLYSSICLIAGEKENFICCDFPESYSAEVLQTDLEAAVALLQKTCEGIIFFTDLKGGSPFQKSVIVASAGTNMEVISGSNLPMVLEICFAREQSDDVSQLAKNAINTGKEQVYRYVKTVNKQRRERMEGI